MKATTFIISLLFVLAIFPLAAEEMTVEYLDGVLELKEDLDWIELDIGDTVPEDTQLRLWEDSFAELSAGAITVTLNQKGIYSTKELLRSGKKVAAWDIGKVVNSRLSMLVSPEKQQQATAMGVRAAKQDKEEVQWVDEEEDLLEEGKELLFKENYKAAIELLLEGADFTFSDERKQEYLFYAAYGYVRLGSNALAMITLAEVEPETNASYFTDYVILKGKLLIENFNFEEALGLFDRYMEFPDPGETTQVVYILSALCNQGLDNSQEALNNLEAAYKIDGTSEYGLAAKRMMGEL